MLKRLLLVLLFLATTANAQLIICGDPDQSESIDVLDAFLVARSTVGLVTLTPTQEFQADVNGSGAVEITDALGIARFVTLLDNDLSSCLGTSSSDCDSPGASINDFQTTNVQILIAGGGTIQGNLDIDVDISHTYIGDLTVTLIHPGGTQVILHNRTGGGSSDIIGNYPGTLAPAQSLSMLDGLTVTGTWTLRVRDDAGGDQGTINNWCINYGSTPASATHQSYTLLSASVTGNNLIPYPFARLTGGGIPENTIQFAAEEWSTGPNRVDEQGGGDDLLLGTLSGGNWSTTMTPGQGSIDANGLYTAGDLTGKGFVDFNHPAVGSARWDVASVPPDWIVGP